MRFILILVSIKSTSKTFSFKKQSKEYFNKYIYKINKKNKYIITDWNLSGFPTLLKVY